MKKRIFWLLIITMIYTNLTAQNVQNYYADGLYQFDDTRKIQRGEVFTTYKSQFGFTNNNSMVLTNEGIMDEDTLK